MEEQKQKNEAYQYCDDVDDLTQLVRIYVLESIVFQSPSSDHLIHIFPTQSHMNSEWF